MSKHTWKDLLKQEVGCVYSNGDEIVSLSVEFVGDDAVITRETTPCVKIPFDKMSNL